MKELKGSRTEKNLLTAFAGESQARNRYTFFANKARKEGYEQIAWFFLDTADNEKEHAEMLYKHLTGGTAEISASFPAGVIGTTAENLAEAAAGENYEHTQMYPEFAKIAVEEGFEEVSRTFRAIMIAERQHERRYLGLLENIKKDAVFKKDRPVKWKCRNCGFVIESKEAPAECPLCKHKREYFELLCENW